MKTIQTKSPVGEYLLCSVVGSAVGSSEAFPVSTLNQASAAYRAFLDSNNLGSREAGRCLIRQGKKIVAFVGFNGCVFPGEKWFSGIQPLFVP